MDIAPDYSQFLKMILMFQEDTVLNEEFIYAKAKRSEMKPTEAKRY